MKKIATLVVISLIISIALTAYSLNYMDYSMVFDEAARAFWGFPFEMVYSEPFYGGFGGSALKEGGREYVLHAVELDDNREVDWIGVSLNLLCYGSVSLVVLVAGSTVSKAVRNLYAKSHPT